MGEERQEIEKKNWNLWELKQKKREVEDDN